MGKLEDTIRFMEENFDDAGGWYKVAEHLEDLERNFGLEGSLDMMALSKERGGVEPFTIEPDDFSTILYFPQLSPKFPEVAIDTGANTLEGANPSIIRLYNDNRLFELPDHGIALSTVYHDQCGTLGCGPVAVWNQLRGTVPLHQINEDLVNLHEHRNPGADLNPHGVVPADLLAHYLDYQGMEIQKNPQHIMESLYSGGSGLGDSIFSGFHYDGNKHTFATLWDSTPVEQHRSRENLEQIDDSQMLFWARTTGAPIHERYRVWSKKHDKISPDKYRLAPGESFED